MASIVQVMGINLNSFYALAWWVLLAALVMALVLLLSERDKRKRREAEGRAAGRADTPQKMNDLTKDVGSTLIAIVLVGAGILIFGDGEWFWQTVGAMLAGFVIGRGLVSLRDRWRQAARQTNSFPT